MVAFYWPLLLQLAVIVLGVSTMLWIHFYRCVNETSAILHANGLAALANIMTVYFFGRIWNASGVMLSMLLGQVVVVVYCMFYWARRRDSILARYLAPAL